MMDSVLNIKAENHLCAVCNGSIKAHFLRHRLLLGVSCRQRIANASHQPTIYRYTRMLFGFNENLSSGPGLMAHPRITRITCRLCAVRGIHINRGYTLSCMFFFIRAVKCLPRAPHPLVRATPRPTTIHTPISWLGGPTNAIYI